MKYEKLALEQYRDLMKKSLAIYQAYDKTKAISIVYAGVQATATAEVTENSLILCAPAATPVLTIDLSAGAPPKADTLSEVVAAINAFGTGFAATLGDQFDGDEASASLTIIEATSVKTTAVWFAFDANISNKIRVAIPTVAAGKSVKLTKAVGNITYTGAGTIEVWLNGVLVWSEAAGATTVEKTATLNALSGEVGEAIVVKYKAATTLTAGFVSVSYEQKDAQPYTVY